MDSQETLLTDGKESGEKKRARDDPEEDDLIVDAPEDKKAKRRGLRKIAVEIDIKKKTKHAKKCYIINKSTYLEVGERTRVYKAHFLKGFFTEDTMRELADTLFSVDYWEHKEDKRGERGFLFSGEWCQQAHYRYGIDHSYPAGKGGKKEAQEPIIRDMLESLGRKASALIPKYRPDVYLTLKEGEVERCNDFGLFHLFMCPAGSASMHIDSNDYICAIFLIHVGERTKGGGLEIGGCDVCFNLRIGDIILMDSDLLWHGTRGYCGFEDPLLVSRSDRLIGIFIIHRPYLRLNGISKEQVQKQ
jgi:hypothetical protein